MFIFLKLQYLISRKISQNSVDNLAVSTEGACGSEKPLLIENSNQGFIQTPNYPNNYPDRSDCAWMIEVMNGTRITIDIADVEVEAR